MRGGQAARIVVLLIAGCLGAGAAHGQLHGHMSMAKEVYLAGEPIYVHFEVTNVGKDPVQFVANDPYNAACGEYRVEVSKDAVKEPSYCAAPMGEPLRCDGGVQILPSGETARQNVLVNYAHDVTKAGTYEIHATRVVTYGPVSQEFAIPSSRQKYEVQARFRIEVVKGDPEALKSIYKVYLTNLESDDTDIQREAERAIVSGAPPWLEDTIEGMVRRSSSREFALLGLKNLNTERSRARLAEIAQNAPEYTEQNEAAVGYLAELGDKKYFPVLLEIAKRQEADQGREYIVAAAELGGADALPYLQELLSSNEKDARANGVAGLGVTGSRDAVPVLLGAMKNGDAELRKLAVQSLQELTHHDGEAGNWESWWDAHKDSANLYGWRECAR